MAFEVKTLLIGDSEKLKRADYIIDVLFCISCALFACTLPFQRHFNPFLGQWLIGTIVYKGYRYLRGYEPLFCVDIKVCFGALALMAYAILCLLSEVWSMSPELTNVTAVRKMLPMGLVALVAVVSTVRLPVSLIMRFLTFGTTCIVGYVLVTLADLALAGDVNFYYNAMMYIPGVCEDISYIHMFFGTFIAISLFYIFQRVQEGNLSIWEKLYYVFHCLLCVTHLVLDTSRMIVLSLFVSAVIYIVLMLVTNRKKLVVPVVVLMILVVIFVLIPTRVSDTADRIMETHEVYDGRWGIWKALMLGLKDVPLLGYGYNATDDVYGELYRATGTWCADLRYLSHNQFLESYYNLGIVGLLLLLVFLLWLLATAKRDGRGLSIGMCVLFTIQMIFDVPFHQQFATILMYALCTNLYSNKKDDFCEGKMISNKLYIVPFVVALGLFCVIGVKGYMAVEKYSTHSEVEMSDFSKTQSMKKARKFFKSDAINDADYVFWGYKDADCIERRTWVKQYDAVARVETMDTMFFVADCFVSDNFDGDRVYVECERKKRHSYVLNVDLTVRNEWHKVKYMLPVAKNVVYMDVATGKERKICALREDMKVFVMGEKGGVSSLSQMNGFVAFKNMRIEKMHDSE